MPEDSNNSGKAFILEWYWEAIRPVGSDLAVEFRRFHPFHWSVGIFRLVQELQSIRNQEANVVKLNDSLSQLQAAFEAGRIGNRPAG